MCLSQPQPVDNSAAIARQQETARQAQVTSGQGAIDSAFSAFNPAYYDQYTKAYTDNYNPQVDDQFAKAKQGLQYDFARRGTLNSTGAQTGFGDLIKSYGDARDQVASNALGATNTLQSQVSANKTNLYNMNASAADPTAAAANAAGSVGSLMTPATYSPLADLFGGLVNGYSSYASGQNAALPAGYQKLFA